MKNYHPDIIAQLESDRFMFAELIEFDLDTPIYLTSASYDITTATATSSGTQTYLAQGSFLNYSGVRHSDELRVNNVSLQLSGSTATFVNMVLQDQYLHKTVKVYKCWINLTTRAIVDAPVLIYSGTMVGGEVNDTQSECQVTMTTSNEFYDFERITGRRSNDNSQQRYFAGDRGMIYSTAAIADIKWGRNA
jgi:hypothetical protein